MTDAFAYGRAAFLGLAFEPFRYTAQAVTYAWSAPAWLVTIPLRLGLDALAFRLFAALVEVE